MKDSEIDELLLEIYQSNQYSLKDISRTTSEEIVYRDGLIYLKSELKLIRQSFGIFSLTPFGNEVMRNGGWIKHLEIENQKLKFQCEKENLEFEKSKIDIDLSKKILKEYPYTKWFARIGFIIAFCLGILELIKYIRES